MSINPEDQLRRRRRPFVTGKMNSRLRLPQNGFNALEGFIIVRVTPRGYRRVRIDEVFVNCRLQADQQLFESLSPNLGIGDLVLYDPSNQLSAELVDINSCYNQQNSLRGLRFALFKCRPARVAPLSFG
jgi:hypothetical protein